MYCSVLIWSFQVKGHRIVLFNAELYYCTVLFNDEWSIYCISRDPVSSNQITRIYIGVIYNVLFNEAKPSWIEHFIFHRKYHRTNDLFFQKYSKLTLTFIDDSVWELRTHDPHGSTLFRQTIIQTGTILVDRQRADLWSAAGRPWWPGCAYHLRFVRSAPRSAPHRPASGKSLQHKHR